MRTFSFQNLLYNKDGKVTGAMSPVLSANEMSKSMFPKYTGLARIYSKKDGYSDIEVNQKYEGPGKQDLTGHDTLLIISHKKNVTVYGIYIDRGCSICPVALWFDDEPVEDTVISDIYKKQSFEDHYTSKEIHQIFKQAQNVNLKPTDK